MIEAWWGKNLGLSVHMKDKTVEEVAGFAARRGFRYLEIVAERFWGLPYPGGPARWAEIRDLLALHSLEPLVHSSFIETNLASVNRHQREAALRQTLECLDFASAIDAGYVIVHAGSLHRMYPASFLDEARACLLESLKRLAGRAGEMGMTVALENNWNTGDHQLIYSAGEHAALIEAVGSPSLRALFDVAHANTFGVDLMDYMERLGPGLVGIHLHDNDGVFDGHRPLGTGCVGREVFRRCLEAGVPAVLELNSFEDVAVSLDYLTANMGGDP